MSLAGVRCLECTYFGSPKCTCECKVLQKAKASLNVGSSDKKDRNFQFVDEDPQAEFHDYTCVTLFPYELDSRILVFLLANFVCTYTLSSFLSLKGPPVLHRPLIALLMIILFSR